MALEEAKTKGNYLNVLADGKFHQEVPEGTEGAVLREYETSDGTKGSKLEKLFNSVSGKITKVDIYDGTFAKSLLLTIEDEGCEPVVVSFNTNSNFGEDMLKKLFSINMDEPVKIAPYSVTDETSGKSKRGVSVIQNGEKLKSFFHSYDALTKKSSPINGYPDVPKQKGKKAISSDEWKIYFAQARVFMLEQVAEKFKIEEKVPF